MDPALKKVMANRDPLAMDKPSTPRLGSGSLSSPARPGLGTTPLALLGLVLVAGLAGCADPNAWKRTACEQAHAQLGQATVQQIELLRKALGLAAEVDPVPIRRSAPPWAAQPPPRQGR